MSNTNLRTTNDVGWNSFIKWEQKSSLEWRNQLDDYSINVNIGECRRNDLRHPADGREFR